MATDFFNGIFKEGLKLEVISMFIFNWRKSKSCVCVCVCGTLLVCMHARICTWAGSNYKVLQAFKPTSI